MHTFYDQTGKSYQEELAGNYNWLIFSGTCLILLGMFILVDIYMPNLSDYYSVAAFALISMILFIHSYKFWYRKHIGLYLHLAAAILYFLIGMMILMQYSTVAKSLLALMILVLMSMGVFRASVAFNQGVSYLGWGWILIAGIIDIILASIIILYQTSFSALLLLVSVGGIETFFTGLALFWLGLNYKHRNNPS